MTAATKLIRIDATDDQDYCFYLCMVICVTTSLSLHVSVYMVVYFFFFQAEDGIRDLTVTGVQTCALPILIPMVARTVNVVCPKCGSEQEGGIQCRNCFAVLADQKRIAARRGPRAQTDRSEERRVGKECRSRWSPDH